MKKIGKNHHCFIHGKSSKYLPKYCINCKKILSLNSSAIRCHSCENKRRFITGICNFKGKNNPNYNNHKKLSQQEKKFIKDCMNNIEVKQKMQKPRLSIEGEKNPNYIHGMGHLPYTKKFNIIRLKILKRDNHTCILCQKIGTHVHHINYNKQNDKRKNLITLCFKCHIKTNFNRDYWFAYFRYLMENK